MDICDCCGEPIKEYREDDGGLCAICHNWKEEKCSKSTDGSKIAQWGGCKKFYHEILFSAPSAGSQYDTYLYEIGNSGNCTDEPNYNKCHITCPHCNKSHYPFRTRYCECVGSGMSWQRGADWYEELSYAYIAICPKTKKYYKFNLMCEG